MKKNIIFIGFGAMGTAIANKIDRSSYTIYAKTQKGIAPDKRHLTDHELKNLSELQNILTRDPIIILALKPYQLESFHVELKKEISLELLNDITIISFLAGMNLQNLQKLFFNSKILRVMPNVPALIGEGVHLVATAHTELKNDVEKLLNGSGSVYHVSEEALDNLMPFTASGPGIIFKIFDILLKLMPQETKDINREMLLKTFRGSTELAFYGQENGDGLSFDELIKQVASKKGVTQKALDSLEYCNLGGLLKKAIDDAYLRNAQINA